MYLASSLPDAAASTHSGAVTPAKHNSTLKLSCHIPLKYQFLIPSFLGGTRSGYMSPVSARVPTSARSLDLWSRLELDCVEYVLCCCCWFSFFVPSFCICFVLCSAVVFCFLVLSFSLTNLLSPAHRILQSRFAPASPTAAVVAIPTTPTTPATARHARAWSSALPRFRAQRKRLSDAFAASGALPLLLPLALTRNRKICDVMGE